jgi:hypothetical protein
VASRWPSKLGGLSAGIIYVKVPPRFGSSSAMAAAVIDAAKAALRPAAHNPVRDIIAFSASVWLSNRTAVY